MADKLAIVLRGDKALEKMIQNLAPAAERKAVRPAANKAWTPVLKAARQKLKRTSKTLGSSLKKKTKTYSRKGSVWVGVLPNRDKIDASQYPTNVLSLIEFGAKRHTITAQRRQVLSDGSVIFGKKIEHKGAKPRPFLRPAFDENQQAAVGIYRTELRQRIPKIAKEEFEKAKRRATRA